MGTYTKKNLELLDGSDWCFRKYTYKTDNGLDFMIGLNRSPLWNCQFCTIGAIEDLIKSVDNIDTIKHILREILKPTEKNLFLCDVDAYSKLFRLREVFKDLIYKELPYKSTNGNDRALVFISTKF